MLTATTATIERLRIPFRFAFEHALASRSVGEGVLLTVRSRDGLVGHGETAARGYVSGEDWTTVAASLQGWLPRWLGRPFDSFEEVVAELRAAGSSLGRAEHAAFCALELALLDLAGQRFGRCAGEVVGPVRHAEVRYSAVISGGSGQAAAVALGAARDLAIDAVKVKVGDTEDEDLRRLAAARAALGDAVSLRVDANCAWDARTALSRLRRFEPFGVTAVEQPCPADDYDALATVTAAAGIPVLADESLVSRDDARRLIDRCACSGFNIRIAKCGGLLLSAELRDIARDAGLVYMLGAQVGETAILAVAGRHFACRSEAVLFSEGSYGDLLLAADVAPFALLAGGAGPAIDGVGLGIPVQVSRIAEFVAERLEVRAGAP